MALNNADFREIPDNPLDWERFFTEVEVVPDPDTVTPTEIATDAVTPDAIASDAVTTVKVLDKNITLPKIQDLTADRIVGRLTSGGVAQELTATQVRDLLFTQQADIADAVTAHTFNATFDNTELEAAMDAHGVKINAILTALDNLLLTL